MKKEYYLSFSLIYLLNIIIYISHYLLYHFDATEATWRTKALIHLHEEKSEKEDCEFLYLGSDYLCIVLNIITKYQWNHSLMQFLFFLENKKLFFEDGTWGCDWWSQTGS